MKTGCLVFVFAALGIAQSLPSNWFGAGAAFTPGVKPPIAGWMSFATLVSAKGQLYSFSSYDITQRSGKPFQSQTSVRSGVAPVIRQLGPFYLLAFGTAGVATSGTTTGGAFSGGGVGVLQLGKTQWTLVVGARVLKTAGAPNMTVYEFGLGRVW